MKKILTVVLDGFGLREEKNGNAVAQSDTKNFDRLMDEYPNCSLYASEEYVGLPVGQFGNSEVGHMTIGAGRLLKQDGAKIDEFFASKEINNNEDFNNMISYLKETNKSIHLMGLLSNGGVHSTSEHLKNILKLLSEAGLTNIVIHVITDGRDTAYNTSYSYIKELQELNIGSIATICGRAYAMDRDNNWDRTKKYYDLITKGIGVKIPTIEEAIRTCYQKEIYDEYIPPLVVDNTKVINDGDVVFWFNYRNDRARQILTALTDLSFTKILIKKMPNLKLITFYPQEKGINSICLLPSKVVKNTLGIYLSDLGLTQARIAETEKYAHVTYFFDGANEGELEGCDKFLISSPKVATYDLKPEMSAVEVTKKCIECMEEDYDFIFLNFANPDMVGHTGDLQAAIKACSAVDICLGKLLEVAGDNFYTTIVLSDHGNSDLMIDELGNKVTTHTLSKVPFIITDKKIKLKDGDLTNVAPTILEYMDIAIPKDMTSESLIIKE